MALPSYASPYAIGHRAIRELFSGPVLVQEKVDGSQFSFGVDAAGELFCRSRGAQLFTAAPDKMFALGIQSIVGIQDKLTPGFVYRGEYLQRSRHNVLAYDRTPKLHVALFDVEDRNKGEQHFLPMSELAAEADRLGFETVPVLFEGELTDINVLRGFLDNISFLGGCKIEGVVVKNYNVFTPDKKVAMGKFVSEAFKEIHAGAFREANPTQGDVIQQLISGLQTPARWQKAVQHLREAGVITDTPKDIGPVIKEVQTDIEKECKEEIKNVLYDHFIGQIRRGVVSGLPEWYKEQVMIVGLTQ